MSFFDYRFITHWRIRGPINLVYSLLKEGGNYSKWWGSAYKSSREVGQNAFEVLVRAKLPYTLRFTTELIDENPPYGFTLRATGELEGTGRWELNPQGETTEVIFYWNVRANKRIIRWFSFLLKPFFVWNHHWVMKEGEKGLQKEVDLLKLSKVDSYCA